MVAVKQLTKKEKLFAAYYARTRDPRASAALAGFTLPQPSAYRLLGKEEIRAKIKEEISAKESSPDEAALCSAQGETISSHSAVISPLRYKNKMYLSGVYTDIGFNSEGHYLYIGPPRCDLTCAPEGSYILSDGVKYRVDRAEKVYAKNRVFYIWAVIRVIIEEDENE